MKNWIQRRPDLCERRVWPRFNTPCSLFVGQRIYVARGEFRPWRQRLVASGSKLKPRQRNLKNDTKIIENYMNLYCFHLILHCFHLIFIWFYIVFIWFCMIFYMSFYCFIWFYMAFIWFYNSFHMILYGFYMGFSFVFVI